MGGSAREWSTTLDEEIATGTLELRLVLTKFGGAAATVRYEVVLEV